jgi:hypothetical protein
MMDSSSNIYLESLAGHDMAGISLRGFMAIAPGFGVVKWVYRPHPLIHLEYDYVTSVTHESCFLWMATDALKVLTLDQSGVVGGSRHLQ